MQCIMGHEKRLIFRNKNLCMTLIINLKNILSILRLHYAGLGLIWKNGDICHIPRDVNVLFIK